MVDDIFPYNSRILNERNGFLYKGKAEFMNQLHTILIPSQINKFI
jgi:hypothetical protein